MVHIAIPLEYRRKQLALALGIDQLADEQKTPRVNLIASAAWNEPHSYIRVRADFIVSQVFGAIKERIMRPERGQRAQDSDTAGVTTNPLPGHGPITAMRIVGFGPTSSKPWR